MKISNRVAYSASLLLKAADELSLEGRRRYTKPRPIIKLNRKEWNKHITDKRNKKDIPLHPPKQYKPKFTRSFKVSLTVLINLGLYCLGGGEEYLSYSVY